MGPNCNIAYFLFGGREGMSFETEKRAVCFAVGTSDPVLVFADWFE